MRKKQIVSSAVLLSFGLLLSTFSLLSWQRSRQDSTGHKPDLTREYLVTQYADATGLQGTFYTITNEDTLIVIDGGWAGNEAAVRRAIAEHGNQVDAWIVSHPHRDHAGAFNAIYANPGPITIDAVYDNGFDYEFIMSVGEPYDDITVLETYYSLTHDAENVTHLKRGDVLSIYGLTFSVYNAYDDIVQNTVGEEKDYQNNASLLFEVSSENSSMLFCSDIKYDMSDYLLANYGDAIACDYVQVGHHGNWSFYENFYEATDASVFFFDAPTDISDNPDFPASQLKSDLLRKNKTVLDFSTAPNTVTLK
ncbi:MAG: ComEC/Rec2 family competence protein [Roseburia sp.]